MSWAILKYRIPNESDDFELAKNGAKLAVAVEDFDSEMRNVVKYEAIPEDLFNLDREVVDKVTEFWRERLHKIVHERE